MLRPYLNLGLFVLKLIALVARGIQQFFQSLAVAKKYSQKEPMSGCPHLSKWPGHLKINGTQEILTFSGLAFYGLSCGVLLFGASVSSKNHKIEAPDWQLKNSSHSEGGF